MELRHVSTFVVLAEELHFGRAAARLYLSVPALSQRVKALERQLGVQLFERDRRHVALTEAGEVFLQRARPLLQAADAAVAEARNHADGLSGQLRIGIFVNNAAELTIPILQRFRASHPAVQVSFVPLGFSDQISALAERRVDVAFVRPPFDDPALSVRTLAVEPRAVLMSPEHPLSDADTLGVADIGTEKFINGGSLGMPKEWTDFWLLRDQREDRTQSSDAAARLDNFDAVLFDIAVNGTVTTVPYSVARQVQNASVKGVPMDDCDCEIAIATRVDEVSQLVDRFRETAIDTSRELISLVPNAHTIG